MNLNRILPAKHLKTILQFSSRSKQPVSNTADDPSNYRKDHGNNSSNPKPSNPVIACYGKNAGLTVLLKDCFTSLLRTTPGKTMVVCALALTLPAAIAIFSASFKAVEKNLLESRNISVFLNEKINLNEATQLAKTLAGSQHILAAELTPVEIQEREILTIDIRPSITLNKAQLDNIVAELNSHISVDFVAADPTWLQQNVQAIKTTRKYSWLSIAITVPVTMLLVYLMSLTDLNQRKPELKVLRQMGASRFILLKPLLLRSLTLTILALTAAVLLVWSVIEILPHIADISTYYQIFPRSFPVLEIVSLSFIAILSSFLAIGLFGRKTINSF